MTAIGWAWMPGDTDIRTVIGLVRPGFIHSLKAGCEFQINKSDLQSRPV
ncbi:MULTISPECIES: hypothetical protein [Phyllobacteriaceae]|jgi:hypothetical protein|nr:MULTISPECIES: hypothetical protein [Mesorhizobium]MBN9233145.1 hypothetical protein [Mesorhizobium sp.]MDQ0332169.1 hypothetical protein [Mesorhizobium sp. YL-MeA3-2017]